MSPPWIVVPANALRGEGLEPYPAGDISALFDWSENSGAASTHLMAHAGDFLLDIVDIEANSVHQHCKPDDEIVFVLAGTLRLKSDVDGSKLDVAAGEAVFIPSGWAGVYRADPGYGRFIEAALVPHDYFDSNRPRKRSENLPCKLQAGGSRSPSERQLGQWRIVRLAGPCHERTVWTQDTLLRVDGGKMSLFYAGERETLCAGELVILPRGCSAELSASADALLEHFSIGPLQAAASPV